MAGRLPDPDIHVITRCCCLYVDANGEKAQREFVDFTEQQGFDPAVQMMAKLHPMETFSDWRDVSIRNQRTTTYASGILKAWRKYRKACSKGGIDLDAVLLACLCGVVGVPEGRELHALATRDINLPTFGDVLNHPDTVPVCTALDTATPFLDSLVRLCTTAHDGKQVLRYIVRHHAEISRCALQKLVAHRVAEVGDAVRNDPVYIQFITND